MMPFTNNNLEKWSRKNSIHKSIGKMVASRETSDKPVSECRHVTE